ncbi:MAG: lytic murein transglycosylase, partial [Bauldia litoralis]
FAGAMGQPQFMPSSYLYYAVDHDRDGRRDIWRTPGDIFASVANYNVRRGRWTKDYNYALTEVKLPSDFVFEQAGFNKPRPIADWIAAGVTRMDGAPLGQEIKGDAVIYLPAGCDGPAFLLNGNFHAIMRYNNLIEYGFAVSVLAEKIRGNFAVRKEWPESDVALTKYERKDLQRLLTRLGHGDLVQDGVLGGNTRSAIRSFQRKHRMCVDGHANLNLFRKVRGRFNRLYSKRSVTARELADAARQR